MILQRLPQHLKGRKFRQCWKMSFCFYVAFKTRTSPIHRNRNQNFSSLRSLDKTEKLHLEIGLSNFESTCRPIVSNASSRKHNVKEKRQEMWLHKTMAKKKPLRYMNIQTKRLYGKQKTLENCLTFWRWRQPNLRNKSLLELLHFDGPINGASFEAPPIASCD